MAEPMLDAEVVGALEALRDASPALQDEWVSPGALARSRRLKLDETGQEVQEL